MGLLERYKKSGGFIQLLALLETCGPQKRDKFLTMIKEENPIWEEALRPRILSLERVFNWSPVVLTEIFTRLQVIHITAIYSSLDESRRSLMSGVLNFNQHKQVKQMLDEKKFTASDLSISTEKFLGECRNLIAQGIIKLDKVDPEMEIPSDIEEKLNTSQYVKSASLNSSFASPSMQNSSPMPSSPPPQEKAEVLKVLAIPNERDDSARELHAELNRLKEKFNQLLQENNSLKNENSQMKDKLERIKKIA